MNISWPPHHSQGYAIPEPAGESRRTFHHAGTCTTSAGNPEQVSDGLQKPPPMKISYLLSDLESNGSPENVPAAAPAIYQRENRPNSRPEKVETGPHIYPQMNSYIYLGYQTMCQDPGYTAQVLKRSHSGNLVRHSPPNGGLISKDSDRTVRGYRAIDPREIEQNRASYLDNRRLKKRAKGPASAGNMAMAGEASNSEVQARQLKKMSPDSALQPGQPSLNGLSSLLTPSKSTQKIKLMSYETLCSAFIHQKPPQTPPILNGSGSVHNNEEMTQHKVLEDPSKVASDTLHQFSLSVSPTLSVATEFTNYSEPLQKKDELPVAVPPQTQKAVRTLRLLRCPVCKKTSNSERGFTLHMKLHSRRFDYLDIPLLESSERSRKLSNLDEPAAYDPSPLRDEQKLLSRDAWIPTLEVGLAAPEKVELISAPDIEPVSVRKDQLVPIPLAGSVSITLDGPDSFSSYELKTGPKLHTFHIPRTDVIPALKVPPIPILKSQFKPQLDLNPITGTEEVVDKPVVRPGRPRMRVKVKRSRGKFFVSLRFKARAGENMKKLDTSGKSPLPEKSVHSVQTSIPPKPVYVGKTSIPPKAVHFRSMPIAPKPDTRVLADNYARRKVDTGPYARDIRILNLLT